MTEEEARKRLEAMREELAAIEHERWSHWQRYLHSKGDRQQDGSLLLPANLVVQWEHQMTTAYAMLSETEKQSDREQVERYASLIATRFGAD
ncbi:hypothetical protein [Acidovorax sp. RAC01]|mgnify:CR=1 FL=1|uniref:hypothetical protein n=1 Tax=Acidovorax sp. RAC01 TaxID=1842533 RepID=UPI00083E8878|nr:hypothetical protein [Acidovorax sp. RAC01]AOG22991.1 hypothetical protein BSY15_3299 [Acidovorax sp. RAC01]